MNQNDNLPYDDPVRKGLTSIQQNANIPSNTARDDTTDSDGLSELREQISNRLRAYAGGSFADKYPNTFKAEVDDLMSLIHQHDQRIIAEAEKRARIDELNRIDGDWGNYHLANYKIDRLAAPTASPQQGGQKDE